MKKTAVLLDLGFVTYALYQPLGQRHPTATEIVDFAQCCLADGEELFRIYCYHCPPYGKTERHPLTRQPVHFKDSATYKTMTALLQELAEMDGIALRSGELSFSGWLIKKSAAEQIAKTGRPLEERDFAPDLRQKRVDMKIGLDVAWLSSKSIVDRIILVSGDSDFVPAMKFARREGIQVIMVTLGQSVKADLRVHADQTRTVHFPPMKVKLDEPEVATAEYRARASQD